MKRTILVMALLLTLGLLVAGCSKAPNVPANDAANQNQQNDGAANQNAPISDNPDAYVDEQIIDENQTVEIGEMI
jgi:hypothetical protein